MGMTLSGRARALLQTLREQYNEQGRPSLLDVAWRANWDDEESDFEALCAAGLVKRHHKQHRWQLTELGLEADV
jgi:hypothetical protein